MEREPAKKRTSAAPADKLVTKNSSVELKEDELKKVSGGMIMDHKHKD